MGNLRSVGGRGEVDLDQRAITTEDDIVDLSELDRSDDRHDEQAPATQNGAGEHDEPSEGQPPAAATQPHRTPGEAPPASDGPGRENDKDFDRWAADRAPGLGSAVPASTPSTPPPVSDAREPVSGDAPTAASGTAGVPCEEATVSPVLSPRSRLRRSGPLSRPLGRLARPAAVIAALTLSAAGTAIAIKAATTSTPHARAHIAASNAPQTAGPSNRAGDALSATIAAVTSELDALARAVPPARSRSHPPHRPRRHRPSHKVGTSTRGHPATVSEQSTASAQTSPPTQTYNSNPAPVTSSSTSQATAGSQTQATSRNQPAFGLGGSLGPGRGAPGTQ